MKKSHPIQKTGPVSFRCTEQFKTKIAETISKYHLTQSEIIRYGVELLIYMLNNPDSYEVIMKVLSAIRQQIELRKEAAALLSAAVENSSETISLIERRDDSMRNIFRLNKYLNDVEGFRVTIVRQKRKFEKAYLDKEYGGIEGALQAAMIVRDYVLKQLLLRPDNFKEIRTEALEMITPPFPSRKGRLSSLL